MRLALAELATLADKDLRVVIDGRPVQVHLYAALRREQRAYVAVIDTRLSEASMILSFADSAYRELTALLAGRDVLDSARDGAWSLRDLLRHAIAVELRYRAQVLWSANRSDSEPLAIPADRLPCDRLTPPFPEFAETATSRVERVLELFGAARTATGEQLATLRSAALTVLRCGDLFKSM